MSEHATDGVRPEHASATPTGSYTFDAAAYFAELMAQGGAGDAVPCGFPSLDSLLGGGFRRGDVIAIGGEVGSGKSALALAMALRAAETGTQVALFSGDFSAERLSERALAIEGRVRVDDLRHARLDDAQHAAVGAAALRLRQSAPLLSHMPPNGVSGLSDLLIEYLGLDLLVVDPLQSLAVGRQAMEEELAQAVRDLKALAVRRACAVIIVAQLARPVSERDDPRPRLDDFPALGAVKHHADVVLALYRQDMYDPASDVDGAAELHVLKNRGGPLGYADLFFYKRWLRFEDMVDPDR